MKRLLPGPPSCLGRNDGRDNDSILSSSKTSPDQLSSPGRRGRPLSKGSSVLAFLITCLFRVLCILGPERRLERGALISLSQVPSRCSVPTKSGTFDVPLKFAPSVNINSPALVPLEAHEWNKSIPNWLCCEAVGPPGWGSCFGEGRRGQVGFSFPLSQTFWLPGRWAPSPPRSMLNHGIVCRC